MNDGLVPVMMLALLFSVTGGSVVARRPAQRNAGLTAMLFFQLLGSVTQHLSPDPGLYALLTVHLVVIAVRAVGTLSRVLLCMALRPWGLGLLTHQGPVVRWPFHAPAGV